MINMIMMTTTTVTTIPMTTMMMETDGDDDDDDEHSPFLVYKMINFDNALDSTTKPINMGGREEHVIADRGSSDDVFSMQPLLTCHYRT